jgi:hypothetical protein
MFTDGAVIGSLGSPVSTRKNLVTAVRFSDTDLLGRQGFGILRHRNKIQERNSRPDHFDREDIVTIHKGEVGALLETPRRSVWSLPGRARLRWRIED